MHTRRYTAFISYRHADNTQEGRRWAEWLHRALERYVVPPDLIGTPNLRGEPIRDSLYPIFRDEDELPANADLATGIRAALEVSDHLIVLCSPRSAVSPWVRKEVREFKELGHSDRILAIIIAGEPNADDPAKAREGILRDEECFCEELRFGAVREDGKLDWTLRTEPTAADLRSNGRAEGFVSAEACREHYTSKSGLSPEQITKFTDEYCKRLESGKLRIIAGLLGVSPGQLSERDTAYRISLAEAEADKQREIAERERHLAEEAHHAKRATERTARRLAIAGAVALALSVFAGWFWWRAQEERAAAMVAQEGEKIQRAIAVKAASKATEQANKAKATSESVVKLVSALQPLATHGSPEKIDAKEINEKLLAWLEKNEPKDGEAELLAMYANLLVYRGDLDLVPLKEPTETLTELTEKQKEHLHAIAADYDRAVELSLNAVSARRDWAALNLWGAALVRHGHMQYIDGRYLSASDRQKAVEKFKSANSDWSKAIAAWDDAILLSPGDHLLIAARSRARSWLGSGQLELAKQASFEPSAGDCTEIAKEAKKNFELARSDLEEAIKAFGSLNDSTIYLEAIESSIKEAIKLISPLNTNFSPIPLQ